MFFERLLTRDIKTSFYQTALNVGARTVDDFNKILLEMTKHVFPTYAFCEIKEST